MKENIAGIRKTYSRKKLLEKKAAADPITQFGKWWKQALKAGIGRSKCHDLATTSADMPAARIVLLKDFDHRGFTFFTNYASFKGQQAIENQGLSGILLERTGKTGTHHRSGGEAGTRSQQ
jgi:pyridoxamine 5'-phosphate oxidase